MASRTADVSAAASCSATRDWSEPLGLVEPMRRGAIAVSAHHDHLFDRGICQLVHQPGNRANTIAGAMGLPFPVALRRKRHEMGLGEHRDTDGPGQCLENLVSANPRQIDEIARLR